MVAAQVLGNTSFFQAVLNMLNVLTGVGLLSVPFALRQAGWAGLGVMWLLGIVTNYTGASPRCTGPLHASVALPDTTPVLYRYWACAHKASRGLMGGFNDGAQSVLKFQTAASCWEPLRVHWARHHCDGSTVLPSGVGRGTW